MVGDEPNLKTYYYHTDHLGSIRAVSDSTGSIVGSYTYDPFGNVIQEQSYPDADCIRFTGKRLDSTGMYYFNARYYDPTIGRFISADPVRQGLNWYVYCNNNPLMFVDPDGRKMEDVIETRIRKGEMVITDKYIAYNYTDNYFNLRDAKRDEVWDSLIVVGLISSKYIAQYYGVVLPVDINIAADAVAFVSALKTLVNTWQYLGIPKDALTPSGEELRSAIYKGTIYFRTENEFISSYDILGKLVTQDNIQTLEISSDGENWFKVSLDTLDDIEKRMNGIWR